MPTLAASITPVSDETDTGMTSFSSTSQETPKISMEDGITKTTQKIKSVSQTNGKNKSHYNNMTIENHLLY